MYLFPIPRLNNSVVVVLCIAVFAGPAPTCCMESSKGAFNESVTACFVQKKNAFQGCVPTYV